VAAQRKAGNPPAQTINGVTTSTTINVTGGGGTCPADIQPFWLTGLETGVIIKAGGNASLPNNSLSGGWTGFNGTGTAAIVTTPVRSGTYALQLHPAGASNPVNAVANFASSQTTGVFRFSVRLAALPTQDAIVATVSYNGGLNYTKLFIVYNFSTGKWAADFGGTSFGARQDSNVTVVAGTWYNFDLRVPTNNSTARTLDWQIDGAAQPTASATDTSNATGVYGLGLGQFGTAYSDYTGYWDDIVESSVSANYPLGDIKIVPRLPNAIHADPLGYLTNFQDNDSTAVDAVSWQRVDEIPMTGTTDWMKQITNSGGGYVGIDFQDTTETCIRGASVIAGMKAQSGAPSAALGTNMLGPATGANNTVWSSASGPALTTTLQYAQGVLTTSCCPSVPGVGPWTQAGVNGAWALFGYCINATSTRRPEIHSAVLELAYRPMTGGTATVTIVGTGGGSTVTTDFPDAGAGIPTLSTWTVTK
jgi:hypothetical protein